MEVKYFIFPNDFDDPQKGQIRSGFSKRETASLTTCMGGFLEWNSSRSWPHDGLRPCSFTTNRRQVLMNGRSGINDANNLTPTDVQECDKQSVNQNPQCPTPTPSPSPSPSPTAMPQTVLIRTNRSDTLTTVRRRRGRGSQRRNFIGTLKRIAFSGLIVRR